jgi:hypothetical protein
MFIALGPESWGVSMQWFFPRVVVKKSNIAFFFGGLRNKSHEGLIKRLILPPNLYIRGKSLHIKGDTDASILDGVKIVQKM